VHGRSYRIFVQPVAYLCKTVFSEIVRVLHRPFLPTWEALRDRSQSQVATLYADLLLRAAATRLGHEKERAAETTRLPENPVRLRADANLADTDLFRECGLSASLAHVAHQQLALRPAQELARVAPPTAAARPLPRRSTALESAGMLRQSLPASGDRDAGK